MGFWSRAKYLQKLVKPVRPLTVLYFNKYLDHNHPTSPLLAKPPELSEEMKLPPSMKFVAANTVGE